MQVTVFGASGKVGRQVVLMLQRSGHRVVAFVHTSNPFAEDATVRAVKGSVDELQSVREALRGSQAVISTLGSWGTKEKNIVSRGTTVIATAMEEANILRLITVTGAGAHWQGDTPGWVDILAHRLAALIAPRILTDGEEHLRLLAASRLDWTCIRSPIMTKRRRTEYHLRLALAPIWATIPRQAVAQCVVDQLEDRAFIHQAPTIYSK